MKQLVLVLFLFGSFVANSNGQTIHEDRKVTKREERFVNRKTDGERKERIKRWKNGRNKRKLNARARRKRNRKGFFSRIFGNKRKKSNLEGKNGWFAREHPRKHVNETQYP